MPLSWFEPMAGATINGRPTTMYHMSSLEFVKSPYYEAMFPMINLSFGEKQEPYVDASQLRFSQLADFEKELSGIEGHSRPFSTVIFIVFTNPQPSDIYPLGLIGTVTCKASPYHDSAKLFAKISEKERHFIRPESTCAGLPGVVDWELKLLVTGVGYKRQGVAASLERAFYNEIRRRTAKAVRVVKGLEKEDWDTEYIINSHVRSELMHDIGERVDLRIRILLSTIKEINGKFYESRGYMADADILVPVGTLGGTVPFTLYHMSKILPLDSAP